MPLIVGFFDLGLFSQLLSKAALIKAKIIIVADGNMMTSTRGAKIKSKKKTRTTTATRTKSRFFISLPPYLLSGYSLVRAKCRVLIWPTYVFTVTGKTYAIKDSTTFGALKDLISVVFLYQRFQDVVTTLTSEVWAAILFQVDAPKNFRRFILFRHNQTTTFQEQTATPLRYGHQTEHLINLVLHRFI